jgi:ATP/maltotriose-dependent transcriptional regulator MalT
LLIAGGCSNREIGVKLLISLETVRWHVCGLYAKIGVRDRRSAVAYAKDLEHPVAAD